MNREQGSERPMTTSSTVYDAYRTNAVETMSPARLIVALYNRLVLDLERGIDAMVRNDVPTSHTALVHAQEIVNELSDALNRDAWPAAAQLASVYDFVRNELVEANVSKDPSRVVVCHDLLIPLRDAWCEAAGLTPSTP